MSESGAKHTNRPQLSDSAGRREGEDDSQSGQSESCPAEGIGEESQDPQDGAATNGVELPQEQDPAGHRQGEAAALLEQSQSCPVDGIGEESQDPQDGAATNDIELLQVQHPAGHRQEEAASLLEQSQSCHGDGTGEESQDSQHGSAPRNIQDRICQGFLTAKKSIRSHPRLTMAVLIVLLVVVAGVSVAVLRSVVPDTPQLLACPKGWDEYRGICYFFSEDHHSWDQAQALCSELGASLAVLKDREIEFLSCLNGNVDHWIGLRRRDQGLQWVNGSSFNSFLKVLDNGECVFLRNGKFWSENCSNERPYMCSKPKTTL